MMEHQLNIRKRIQKHLEEFKHDVSSMNITLICSNGKFKVNPNLVAGLYCVFEHILLKLSDEGPTILPFPDLKTEDLESSFLSLYQQQYEEAICKRWHRIIETNETLKEVDITDFLNETFEDKGRVGICQLSFGFTDDVIDTKSSGFIFDGALPGALS